MPVGERSPYLSTPEAARALGVSVSTVKRWVDEGVLPAHRTAGGHRKLLRAEVLAVARQGGLPRGDAAALAVSESRGRKKATTLDEAATALGESLIAGCGPEVAAIVRRLYEGRTPLETLADRVIAPAMTTVGREWAAGRIEVWEEHRATQLCAAALFDLKEVLEARAEKNRPIALGGAPSGDPYLLATLLAQYVLLDAGWEAVNLGPDTPLASLAKATEELKPRLIWLSVTSAPDEKAFIAEGAALCRLAERHGAAVAIGGRGLGERLRAAIPYTNYGDGLSHLAAFARTLHPRPRPPRRGRPPKGA